MHAAAIAAVVLLLLPGLRDVPISRDEAVYHRVARNVEGWFRLLASSPSAALSEEGVDRFWRYNHEHPGAARLLAAGSRLALGGWIDPVAALRAGNALLAVLVVFECFHFMRRSFGAAAGWFSAIGVLLIPCLYGHACIAAMDFPAAAFGFLATTAFARGTESRRWAVLFGIAFGLALNSKINAFFVSVPLVLWGLAYRPRRIAANLLAMFALAPAVWLLTWPWLWHDAPARLFEYLTFHGEHHNPNAIYFGEVFHRRAPPWHYPFAYLLLSVPLGLLLPAAAAVARAVGTAVRGRTPPPLLVLLLAALLTPVIVCALPSVPRYDGSRLFLGAFPFVACVAGAGFAEVLLPAARRVAERVVPRRASVAAVALGLGLLGSAALGMWRVHPFEPYSYYNALAGGPRGALGLGLSPVTWAMVDRRAVAHLNRFARAGEVIYGNTGASNPLRAYRDLGLLRDDLEWGPRPHWVVLEYNLAYSRWRDFRPFYENRHRWYERELQIEAAGAPVLGVFHALEVPRPNGRGADSSPLVLPPGVDGAGWPGKRQQGRSGGVLP